MPPSSTILGPGAGKVVALPGATVVFKALSGRDSGDYVVVEVGFTSTMGFAWSWPILPGPEPDGARGLLGVEQSARHGEQPGARQA